MRVLTGPGAENQTQLAWHCDATVVTVLVPIFIDQGPPENVGGFVYIPNKRPVRRNVFVNVAEKLVLSAPPVRETFSRQARARDPRVRFATLVPGNLYAFCGYRTYHANFSVAPGVTRATLLLHWGDPHRGSIVTNSAVKLRAWRVKHKLG